MTASQTFVTVSQGLRGSHLPITAMVIILPSIITPIAVVINALIMLEVRSAFAFNLFSLSVAGGATEGWGWG